MSTPYLDSVAKRCPACNILKNRLTFFYQRANGQQTAYCKQCTGKKAKKRWLLMNAAWKSNNRTVHQKWMVKNILKMRAYHKKKFSEYRRKDPIKHHLGLLKRRGCKLALDDFRTWYNKQDKICSYCDITPELVEKLKWFALFSPRLIIVPLTIDRKNNDIGYEIDNICFSCSVCNSLKTSFFGAAEFREIAQKYIKPKWQIKLKSTQRQRAVIAQWPKDSLNLGK